MYNLFTNVEVSLKKCIDCSKEIKSSSRCSKCWSRKWRAENPERYRELRKKHYEDNREENIIKAKKWNKENPDRAKASHDRYVKSSDYYNERYKNDINYRLRVILRNRLLQSIKTNAKAGSAVEDLGCSISEFKTHLESKFEPGMSWENLGEWHIDHIKPLAKFDLTNREQFLEATNYKNLQPLWKTDNLRKKDT